MSPWEGQVALVTGANSGTGAQIALAPGGEPAEVAPSAVWLASDGSDRIAGTTILGDGGMWLYPGFRTGG